MNLRQFDDSDFDAVISVHKECFATFDFDYQKYIETYRKFFTRERTIVAVEGRDINGFCCYTFFDDAFLIEPDMKQSLDDCIFFDESVYRIKAKLIHNRNEFGYGRIVVDEFQNKFSRAKYKIQDKDAEISSLAVLPECRRNGIGRILVQESLQIARHYGSKAVFAHCWEGNQSPLLFTSLGFSPIVRIGPMYNDGSSALVVGKYV